VVEPLALETVAACLGQEHEVKILDFFTYKELQEVLSSFKPDLCGISCGFTIDVYQSLEIAKAIRESGLRTFVLVGGHHPSMNPQDFHKTTIDAIVVGEGEETLPEVVSCLEGGGDLKEIRGLVINSPEGQFFTGPRPALRDLDALPFPARHLTRRYRKDYYLTFWKPLATLETARGCPYRCNYCSVWKFYQGKCRTRSPEWTVAAVQDIKERYIMFTDDNFLLDVPRAQRIATLLKEAKVKKSYLFQARSDAIVRHPEVVKVWREVGLENIFIGFEAIEDEALASLNKKNAVANNEQALEIANSYEVGVTASFIVDPEYGAAEFEKLRRYVKRLRDSFRHFIPSFSVLTPLPGTDLAHQIRDRIATTNYELFDLLHSVLPTRLSLPDFYKEFASCYAVGYTPSKVIKESIVPLITNLVGRRFSPTHLARIVDAVKMLTDHHFYLMDHQEPKGEFA
jgi:radical SAM superfamily enzyme YgiQ (UPF0313 family)